MGWRNWAGPGDHIDCAITWWQNMSPQGIWHVMRAFAIARHRILHAMLNEPDWKWAKHERIIKEFYGY